MSQNQSRSDEGINKADSTPTNDIDDLRVQIQEWWSEDERKKEVVQKLKQTATLKMVSGGVGITAVAGVLTLT